MSRSGCPTTTKGFNWLCTLNNPTDEERALIANPPDYVQELWYQDEIGEKEGTLHIQLAMRTTEVRKSAIIKDFPRMWVDKAINKLACANYCSKGQTSVPGSRQHWTRQTDTETNEPEKPLTAAQVMLMIALWIPDDNLLSDPEVQYQESVRQIIQYTPELLPVITGSRVLPQWRLTYPVFIDKARSMSCTDEQPTDELHYYLDIDCECSKDNCYSCTILEALSIKCPAAPACPAAV